MPPVFQFPKKEEIYHQLTFARGFAAGKKKESAVYRNFYPRPAPIIWDPIHVAQKNKNEEKIKYSFHFCNRHLQRTCLLPSRPCGSFSFHSSRPIGSAPKTLDEIAKRFEIARFREWPSFLPLGAPYPMGPEPSARPPSPARLRRGKHLLRSVDESEKKKSTFLPLDHW